MTEDEWLSCTDPLDMIGVPEVRSSERKMRLFVIACCRRVWHLLSQPHYCYAVEIAERFADGDASMKELARARAVAEARYMEEFESTPSTTSAKMAAPSRAFQAASLAFSEPGLLLSKYHTFAGRYRAGSYGVMRGVDGAANAVAYWSTKDGEREANEAAGAAEQIEQCRLLRDLIGNPFLPLTIKSELLSWNEAVVLHLAQAAYDNRVLPSGTLDNTRLAILADALEEAGCTDRRILGHLRCDADHYRGCFVIDALLGKS